MPRLYGRKSEDTGNTYPRLKIFLSLKTMLLELENDAAPAHKEEVVCPKTLLTAFPNITIWQTIWLVCWLETKLRVENEIDEDDEVSHQHIEREAADKIQEIYEEVLGGDDGDVATPGITARDDATPVPEEAKKEETERERDLRERIAQPLQAVATSMSKLRRDQERLVKKVDTLYAVMPRTASTGTSSRSDSRARSTSPRQAHDKKPLTARSDDRNGRSAATSKDRGPREWKKRTES